MKTDKLCFPKQPHINLITLYTLDQRDRNHRKTTLYVIEWRGVVLKNPKSHRYIPLMMLKVSRRLLETSRITTDNVDGVLDRSDPNLRIRSDTEFEKEPQQSVQIQTRKDLHYADDWRIRSNTNVAMPPNYNHDFGASMECPIKIFPALTHPDLCECENSTERGHFLGKHSDTLHHD